MPHGKRDTLCNVEQIPSGMGLNQEDKTSLCIVTLIHICTPVKDSGGEGAWDIDSVMLKHTFILWF